MGVKCKIKMSDRVEPVPGSAKGESARATGVCPECETPGVMLSVVGGYVRGHVVAGREIPENNPQATAVTVVADDGRGMSVKCTLDGEPITVKAQLLPVAGSVRESVAGEFQGGTIKNPDRAGECPQCRAFVALSSKGFVTAHTVHAAPVPVSKALSERSVEPADMGARVGDPSAALQRRSVELEGAFEAGMIRVPVKGENGRTKLSKDEVPATEENVRLLLDYWRGKKPRSESGRAEQSRRVSALVRRLEAMRLASVVVHADVDAPVTASVVTVQAPVQASMGAHVSPDGLTTPKGRGVLAGAPVVKGRPMEAMAGEVSVRRVGDGAPGDVSGVRGPRGVRAVPDPRAADAAPGTDAALDTRTGWESRAGTMAGPLGRDRLDRVAAEGVTLVEAPGPVLSVSVKRRLRRERCREAWVRAQLSGKGSGKRK